MWPSAPSAGITNAGGHTRPSLTVLAAKQTDYLTSSLHNEHLNLNSAPARRSAQPREDPSTNWAQTHTTDQVGFINVTNEYGHGKQSSNK